ncbi:MAG TPA: hypothetical protein VND22_01310 [Actinomycetota bacterium]|nr:hypothetical protein [Actinomycetota bacterium]
MSRKLKALLTLLIVLAVAAPACQKEDTAADELLAALAKTERQSREFVYSDSSQGIKQEAVGKVQDDLRSQTLVRLDGQDLAEAIISDDALALRFINVDLIPGFRLGVESGFLGSRVTGQAMLEGRWVIDYDAAPPLLPTVTDEGSIEVGNNPGVDAAYIFHYARRAIDEGRQVWDFNKDDLINYRPSEEIKSIPEPEKDLGIKRYDILPPALPRRSQRGTQSALPGTAHFRKMSFYVKGGEVLEIKELIDFERHPDFKKAREGKGPQYHLRLLESVRQGKAREPIRVRQMSYRFVNLGQSVDIQLPLEAVPGNLEFFNSGPPRGGGPPPDAGAGATTTATDGAGGPAPPEEPTSP